ncbi:MAG: VOC family protein [Deltaproteobacteria bacterium]|nr:VOC family protein [Deltaproteobacteria bacterium]
MRTTWILAAALALAGGCKRDADQARPLADEARACDATHDLGCPRTILWVADLATSQRYYRDKLGFKIDWTDGDPADFGAVTRGHTQLFMCQRCQGHPGSWLWVFTPDVDRLHKELVQRGALIQSPPDDKPWGVREMQVADPDGNVLRIGSPSKPTRD